jgi:asparagine synthase (glutamine-hydrolysing)
MCGIAGAWRAAADEGADDLAARARAMADALAHRGPDDEGVWVDAPAGIALSQRRLAVVDLSPLGHQPMVSASGRTVLVYNGELYNTAELRRDLEARGARLRGTSDTEVLLEAIDRDGVAATLPRCIGMFALAAWDRDARTLTLARDRLGIKPLFVALGGAHGAGGADGGAPAGTVLFASELSAIRRHPSLRAVVDRGALAALLRRGCVPGEHAMLVGVRQLAPGTLMTIARRASSGGLDGAGLTAEVTRYWDLEAVTRDGAAARADTSRSDDEMLDELGALIDDAVARRMLADVPLGAFLSGGVDSSLVVASMQASSDRPVRTFTIGTDVASMDESAAARAVAAHLGTEHTELVVTDAEAVALAPRLLATVDQPLADSSLVPTHLVSALARRDVTVALSGDGGDELFAGYTRHRTAASLGRLLAVPAPLRRAGGAALTALPPGGWDALARLVPARRRPQLPGAQVHKLARVLAARDVDDVHHRLTSAWPDPAALVVAADGGPGRVTEPASWTVGRDGAPWLTDPVERMLLADTLGYLPDDILAKVDRASMAVSLEARVPLLDHRVVELAWRLPMRLRLRDGRTKWALRELLARSVPPALTDRAKHGFAVPVDRWLRGPLRPWAEELLGERRLAEAGLLRPAPIRRAWAEHLAGRADNQHALWAVLAVAAWDEAAGGAR